jgi:hypothetical protein
VGEEETWEVIYIRAQMIGAQPTAAGPRTRAIIFRDLR